MTTLHILRLKDERQEQCKDPTTITDFAQRIKRIWRMEQHNETPLPLAQILRGEKPIWVEIFSFLMCLVHYFRQK